MPAPPPIPPPGLSKNTNKISNQATAPVDRSALLQQIQKGKSLKHVKAVQDRSAPILLTNGINNGNGRKHSGQANNLAVPCKEPAKNKNEIVKSPANSKGSKSPAKSFDDDQLCMRDLKSMLESKMRFAGTPSPAHSATNVPSAKVPPASASRNSPLKITPDDQLTRRIQESPDHVTISRESAGRGSGDPNRATKFATLGRRPTPQGAVPPPLPKKPPTLRRLATRPPPFDGSSPGRVPSFSNHLPVSTSALALSSSICPPALTLSQNIPPTLPARNRSLINLCSRDCLDAPPAILANPQPPPPLDRSTKCTPTYAHNHRENADKTIVNNYNTHTVRPDLNRSLSITALPVINHKLNPVPPTPSRRQPLPDFQSQSGPNLQMCNGPTKTLTPIHPYNVQSLAEEFERRFPFNQLHQFSRPHYYSDALKLYPSKSAANKQKQRSRPPPPPPAPRV